MPLKVMWIGYGGNSPAAEALRPTIVELGMSLVTIHEWDNADIKWERTTWLSHLRTADIIIVPANWDTQPAKSNNRLTQALALGKPVICSPLPAYVDIVQDYPDSFLIAYTQEQWREHLITLRDSPDIRAFYSQKALTTAQYYSISVMGHKWLNQFADLDKVDIVIPTYNNPQGLKLCLESIKACTDSPLYNIIVVYSGKDEATHRWLDARGDIQYVRRPPTVFAPAVNAGIRAGKAKYVCILNDDVIVSRGWLRALVDACVGGYGATGPLSNCDKGWLHNFDINIGGVNLLPGSNTIEQIEPIIPQIYAWKSPWADMPDRAWLAFYCTLIPRAVLDKVGLLNESYVNSGEDVDLCRRIAKMGYGLRQTYKSFVFHFGAVSRKGLEAEDKGSYQAADKKTNLLLHHLWDRQSVMIYSGPAWERWDFRNLENGGIGGSEVWQVQLSRELNALGYRVVCFADCPESGLEDNGVIWKHYSEYNAAIEQHWWDYAILSRTTDPLNFPLRAGKVFVQAHDIWLLSPAAQTFEDRVTKFCCLSDWHKEFFSNHHKVRKESVALTPNGIDFSRFDSIQGVERNPYRLMYSSSADRGLDTLLYLYDFIKVQIPQLELHVFYGFNTWEAAVKQRGNPYEIKRMEDIKEGLKKPGVVYHGRVSQENLAREWKKSSLWAHPTDFEETYCCLPGTTVSLWDERKAIESVRVGDSVLTHLGVYKQVTKTYARTVSEKTVRIKVKYLPDELCVTKNHRVLVMTRGSDSVHCVRMQSSPCTKRALKCQEGVKYCKQYYTKKPCWKIDQPYHSEWIPAGDLRKGDYLLYPINKQSLQPQRFSQYAPDPCVNGSVVSTVDICGKTHITKAHRIKDFDLTDDFLQLCGWFISEGHHRGNCAVSFSLNKKEAEEAEFIRGQIGALDLSSWVCPAKDCEGMTVCTSSVVLGRFMTANFGEGAKSKHLPSWVKDLPIERLKHVLAGVFWGDGSKAADTVVLECSSIQLVTDLFEVLLKFGCVSSISKCLKCRPIKVKENGRTRIVRGKKEVPAFKLCCSISQNPDLFNFLGYGKITRKSTGMSALMDTDYVYLPIFKMEEEEYSGSVFNLEVEGDNSYVANGVIVHNCITALEAQRAGVPILSSNYAGLRTTVGDSGLLIGDGTKGQSYTKEYREKFVEEAVSLLTDKAKWQHWSERGFKNTEDKSWTHCAKRWQELFKGEKS